MQQTDILKLCQQYKKTPGGHKASPDPDWLLSVLLFPSAEAGAVVVLVKYKTGQLFVY